MLVTFSPAMSDTADKAARRDIRSRHIDKRRDETLNDLAKESLRELRLVGTSCDLNLGQRAPPSRPL